MTAFYNEHDAKAAAWLRELIKHGHIAPGIVDERSIVDLEPEQLRGYTQCHFFAGIGVWSYALRRAGWADDRPVWTGSCPCQPFSAAGKGDEFADERHLWPAWFRLIRECGLDTIFGEQVASKDALAWFDHVSTDLEGEGYAVGAVDTPASGYGAPHIRQRLYFVADSDSARPREGAGRELQHAQYHAQSCSIMGDADIARSQGRHGMLERPGERVIGQASMAGPTGGFWANAEWIACRDGKARATEPGTFPLAHGSPARVGRLRGYGNAIVAPQAEEFVRAFMEYAA